MNTNPKISLLQSITSSEIDDLIIEHKLKEQGYNFSYFIDNYDISNFSFPFGIIPDKYKDDRYNKSIEVITDEQIAYQYLVNKEKYIFLFDEHIEEVNKYIKNIRWIKYYGIKIINTLQKFINYFKNIEKSLSFDEWKDFEETKNIILSKNNVSILISIALGSLSDGEKRLTNLINNVLVIKFEDADKTYKIDKNILEECSPNELTEKIFDELISQYRKNEVEKDINRLASKYNKCKVFNRLHCINNKSIKNNKNLFLLLSSTVVNRKRIPGIIKKLNYPIYINGLYFNPNRSIEQIYLNLLLQNNKNPIEKLENIKKLIEYKEELSDNNVSEEIDEFLYDYFEKRISELRENYENISLLLNINNFKNEFKKALNTNEIKTNPLLVSSLKELLKLADNNKMLIKEQEFALNEIEYYRETFLIIKKEFEKQKSSLSGFSGNDYIKSPFHSIPFVFFNKNDERFNKIIDSIIKLITESYKREITSFKLYDLIKNNFRLLLDRPVNLKTDVEKIILLITLLLIKRNSDFEPNKIANDWIDKILEEKNFDQEWYNDFLYLKSWVVRRIGTDKKYDEAISIAKEGIKNDSDDPRFYQSLLLTYYCKFKESKQNNKTNINFLNQSIKNAEIALKKYNEIGNGSISIQKSIIAIYNSFAFMYAIKFEYDNQAENIIKAREYINILKSPSVCPEHSEFPEFQHTEAYIEYLEYLKDKNINKLYHSHKRLNKAINIIGKDEYLNLNKLIEDEINKNKSV